MAQLIKQDTSFFQNAMNLGALTGLVLSAIQLVFLSIGISEDSNFQFVLYLILILAISWGIRKYRDYVQEGYISYGSALGFGILIGLGASIVFSFFFYIWMKFIDHDYVARVLEHMEMAMYESEMPDDQIEAFMNVYKTFFGPGILAFGMVFNYTIIGLIGSLIISIFARNPKPMFEE